MSIFAMILLGLIAGAGAGVLAGLLGIGGGIIIVPVVYFGLLHNGTAPNVAAHIAVATSLAAIVPAAIASFLGHWRAVGHPGDRVLVTLALELEHAFVDQLHNGELHRFAALLLRAPQQN